MITFTKGNDTKLIAENSSIIEILKEQGWVAKETKNKESKDVKSSSTGN